MHTQLIQPAPMPTSSFPQTQESTTSIAPIPASTTPLTLLYSPTIQTIESKEEKKTEEAQSLIEVAVNNNKKLASILELCKKIGTPDQKSTEENLPILREAVSDLVSGDINILFKNSQQNYITQLRIALERKIRPEDDKGWWVENFLPLHIYTATKILLRLQNKDFTRLNSIHPYTTILMKQEKQLQEAKNKLWTSILIALECLQLLRLFSLAKLINDPAKKAELAEAMLGRISSLKIGDEYVLPMGWSTHAIYVTLIKIADDVDKENILIRCDNAGTGSIGDHNTYPNSHPFFANQRLHPKLSMHGCQFIATRAVGQLSPAHLPLLKDHCLDLIASYDEKDKLKVISTIYDKAGKLPQNKCSKPAILSPLQAGNNCATHSWYIGERDRLSNADFFNWLLTQQLNIMLTEPTLTNTLPKEISPPPLQILFDPKIHFLNLVLIRQKISNPPFLDYVQLTLLLQLLKDSSVREKIAFINSWIDKVLLACEKLITLKKIDLRDVHFTQVDAAHLLEIIHCLPNLRQIHFPSTPKKRQDKIEKSPYGVLFSTKHSRQEESTSSILKRPRHN